MSVRNTLMTVRRVPALSAASAIGLVTVAISLAVATASERSAPAVAWDAAASKSLEVDYHKLHDAWNALDVKALKNMLAGDDVLATFDLDPETERPIKLRSKAEMDRFTDRVFTTLAAAGVKIRNEHPLIACRATASLGICTEECRINLQYPDGRREVQLLRATAVATRHADGWKFIQWHMSAAGPTERVGSTEPMTSR